MIPLLLAIPFGLLGQTETGPFDIEEVDIIREPRLNLSPCTQYTELGSTVSLWDWRAPSYDIVYKGSNNTSPTFLTTPSPFYTTGVNINHLAFAANGPRDYEPADGWELLYRNLGTAENPVNEPSFALYNRLDGRIVSYFSSSRMTGMHPIMC